MTKNLSFIYQYIHNFCLETIVMKFKNTEFTQQCHTALDYIGKIISAPITFNTTIPCIIKLYFISQLAATGGQ